MRATLAEEEEQGIMRCLRIANLSLIVLVLNFLSFSASFASEDKVLEINELRDISLQQLLALDVSSLAKKNQKLSNSAASISVITQEDLHESGVTNVPDALRLVPGVQVARINGNSWAISIRGFNGEYSNKLLVLIDGRSVYSPLYSGVHWDIQDLMLEDIERIEVIRGPGGSLWGANAVNGVINIITYSSENTLGDVASLRIGTREKQFNVRHGDLLSDIGYFRIYARHREDRGGFWLGTDKEAYDSLEQDRVGFRSDLHLDDDLEVTFQGDIYEGTNERMRIISGETVFDEIGVSGHNLLTRWTYPVSLESELQVQVYYDVVERNSERIDAIRDYRRTFDFDMQYRHRWNEKHEFIWGLGYRNIDDEIRPSVYFNLHPNQRSSELFSAFIQDEITLSPAWCLSLGTKLEHNDYTGFELQPSARLLWKLSPSQTTWVSISRAVRTPSRIEREVDISTEYLSFTGKEVRSESLLAYEMGYRFQWQENLSLDISTFYHRYDDLIYTNVISYDKAGFTHIGATNLSNPGKTYGLESSLRWQIMPNWRLFLSYSWLQADIAAEAGFFSPEHQFQARSNWRLNKDWDFNLMAYLYGDAQEPDISAYTRLDTQLNWHYNKHWQVMLVGQNLLDGQHPEYMQGSPLSTEVTRSVYFQILMEY